MPLTSPLIPLDGWRAPDPRRLPVWRHRLVSALATDAYRDLTVDALAKGQGTLVPAGPDLESVAARLVAEERRRLTCASLYAATPEMTRLAVAAAATLPTRRLASTSLPARHGLMVFGEPIAAYVADGTDLTVRITAVSWGPFDPRVPHWAHLARDYYGRGSVIDPALADHPWLWLTYWSAGLTDEEAPAHARLLLREADPAAAQALLTPLRWDNENLVCLDLPEGVEPGRPREGRHTWYDIVCAAFRLMADCPRIVGVQDRGRPRGTVKRDARAGYDPGPVRVVHLYNPQSAPRRTGTGLGAADGRGRRHLTERHDVSGHWKYKDTPKPVWVEPYERGPKDAPKRVRPKVTVWDRAGGGGTSR